MPKRDLSQLAKFIVDQTTGEVPPKPETKNAAAVALGKLGGKARAAAMTKEQLADSAKKANAARWPKKPSAEGDATAPKLPPRRGVIRPSED